MRLGRETPVTLNDDDPLREQRSGKDGHQGPFHATGAVGHPRMDAAIHTGDVLRAGRYEIQRLLRSARDKKGYLARDRELGWRPESGVNRRAWVRLHGQAAR